LTDFDLSECQIRTARFAKAQFNGDAWLNGAQFPHPAKLISAQVRVDIQRHHE